MLEFTTVAVVLSCVCKAYGVQVWNTLDEEMIDTTR